MNYYKTTIKTTIGDLTLVANENALASVWFGKENDELHSKPLLAKNPLPILLEAERQLKEYFAGKRQEFNLPMDLVGTEFQKKVWKALGKIPYGRTTSYGELATKINSPQAYRAVGAATGKNPIPIILPCHRLIGSDGSLTGFGWGLRVKKQLLELEQNILEAGDKACVS